MVRRAVLSAERARDDEVADENRMIERLAKYRGDVLFVFGGNDPETVVAAGNYERFCAHHGIPARFHEVRDANHSFYSLAWEREVLDLTVGWLSAWSERTC
jgi:acetyl esterase/lipase